MRQREFISLLRGGLAAWRFDTLHLKGKKPPVSAKSLDHKLQR